ncbi:MAG: hypothetical protein EBX69_12385, partial [Betaproteobacteria bacterium]|nr:hypothetical protein [Betaproteobacteria bacterium]
GIVGDERFDLEIPSKLKPQQDITLIVHRHDGSRLEGGITIHQPSGESMSIYDAAMRYIDEQTPTLIFGGEEYGTGSSRDWAAKGTQLLGVKAVVARSFERIHRSNLVGMGVLPLQFKAGTIRFLIRTLAKVPRIMTS